jgi:glutathione synthase/RimK-type ligase-like ATP-grasp enzyme
VLNSLALKHGFNIPKTWKVRNGNIPTDIEYPVMTKAIHSFGKEWKDIVFICNNKEELKQAFEKIQSEELLLQQYILPCPITVL